MAFDYYRTEVAVPQLVARGHQSVACMTRGPAGLEPVPVPEQLRTALTPYLKIA